jgi:hypothetical protein
MADQELVNVMEENDSNQNTGQLLVIVRVCVTDKPKMSAQCLNPKLKTSWKIIFPYNVHAGLQQLN